MYSEKKMIRQVRQHSNQLQRDFYNATSNLTDTIRLPLLSGLNTRLNRAENFMTLSIQLANVTETSAEIHSNLAFLVQSVEAEMGVPEGQRSDASQYPAVPLIRLAKVDGLPDNVKDAYDEHDNPQVIVTGVTRAFQAALSNPGVLGNWRDGIVPESAPRSVMGPHPLPVHIAMQYTAILVELLAPRTRILVSRKGAIPVSKAWTPQVSVCGQFFTIYVESPFDGFIEVTLFLQDLIELTHAFTKWEQQDEEPAPVVDEAPAAGAKVENSALQDWIDNPTHTPVK